MHRANQLRLANRAVFWAFPIFMFLQWAVIIDQVDGPWDVLRDTTPASGRMAPRCLPASS